MKNTFEDKKALLELKTLLELYVTDYNTFIDNWDQFHHQHNNFNISTYFLEDKFFIFFSYKKKSLTNCFKDDDNIYKKIINKIEDIILFEDFEKQKEENLKEQYDEIQNDEIQNDDPISWFIENWNS